MGIQFSLLLKKICMTGHSESPAMTAVARGLCSLSTFGACGDLNESGPHKLMGSGSFGEIKACGLNGGSVPLDGL